MTQAYHVPVMLEASLEALNLGGDGHDGHWMDATFGGGGHSAAILGRLGPGGRLFGFDQDPDAAANALTDERFTLVPANFRFAPQFLRAHGGLPLRGVLADLGVSSHQFDTPERGFSLRHDGPLDMRMNPGTGPSAAEWLAKVDVQELTKVLARYGEVQRPDRLARALLEAREQGAIDTTGALVRVLTPFAPRGKENKFFAQVFQALRIHINDELGALEDLLTHAVNMLEPGGRLAVMSYHSLEDRLVKHFMRSGNFDDDVQRDLKGQILAPFHPLVRKAIVATDEEMSHNPRARSARLRVAERTTYNP
ncbi:MAG: 16S rRNA (cytosine(1402)-N(4))-methyltransferase RsmH [Bacteroidetes bacterium]|nr:16S rRNA (cytosine(1402)-N(4))-methyltransferase RsmH [Bacteroidota bacterium]MDA0903343.1 16S rRNA (cytosine(1402)-N(4))-methyltransferase RsmH [Bacteroidota bacterium]MDA1242309.1 16S rRNA (cytosine(1402)-N(4))-methyltransferase RsmH [Bacteroidota bacterium]